jgi:hypothetical protein
MYDFRNENDLMDFQDENLIKQNKKLYIFIINFNNI